ncbi:hypothetical protein FSB65_39605 [Paraburkholderia sp. JPY418]|nr:hypothetical protein [Paraburkholderia youngii]
MRQYAQQHGGKLPAAIHQALFDAANEIKGSEESFAVVVDEKRALLRKLTQTESNLRGAYDLIARQSA